MTRASKSILIFGIYSLIMGTVLLFLPHVVLPLSGLPLSGEPWLNLLGFVLMSTSYYYIRSALSGDRAFPLYTIHTRLAAPCVVAYLVLTNKADWHFVSFGIADRPGGLWTWLELRAPGRNG